MSVHRFIANHRNLIRERTVNGATTRASDAIFPTSINREGNGRISLTGSYTGQDSATFDVEIRPAGGASTRLSQPVFAGAGNGSLDGLSVAPGTPSQAVTVTLVDLGTETTAAEAVIYGDILLRAKTPGAGGNAISVTVAPSLALSASPVGALSAALAKDAQEWADQKHDFGAIPLAPDGTVPATAPRLVFGGNASRVYRHYKRWDGEQWQYGVSPKLAADFAAGSTVHTVSGTYAVTVTDGATPEIYPGLTTLYDFLLALNASALVEVAGAVGKDLKPGGMAAIDLPLRTAAFALPVIASAPERMPELQGLTVAAGAPTETVTVECIANAPIGAEVWAVKSKVAGALANAVTGTRYAAPHVAFTVPVIPRTGHPVSGTIQITAEKYANADTEKGSPAVCLYRPVLGARAANKTLNLVWTKRPADDCDCEDATVTGGPERACLGVNIEGEGSAMAIPAWYQTRLETLYGWRADFVAANTAVTAAGELRAAQLDIELCDLATGELAECLADLHDELGDTTPASAVTTAWDAAMTALDADLAPLESLGTEAAPNILLAAPGTAYSAGDIRRFEYGYFTGLGAWFFQSYNYYRCVSAGTTAASTTSGSINPGFGSSAWEQITATDAAVAVAGDNQDINSAAPVTTDPGNFRDPATFAKRYRAKMDRVRALAGIVPKSDAGSDGSACWRDPDAAYYWVVNGGEYLPVSNNTYWHSCQIRYNPDTRKDEIVSTHEFGFGVRVACEDRLAEGDTITISIGDVTTDYPYQIGDKHEIPLVAGGPIAFAGGVTGTDTLTWTVKSSTAGALPDYALTAAELAYSGGGLSFTVRRGAIPFALGDLFAFGVETGGRFRWRKDGGAWSADTAIADAVTLADGLSAAFAAGPAPSFVAGDSYSWRVDQPYSPANVRQPVPGVGHRWTGADQTLAVDLGSVQPMDAVCVALHTLPAAATLTLAGSDDGVVWWTESMPVLVGPIVKPLSRAARYLELHVMGASGAQIGWWWVGEAWSPSGHGATTLRLSRQYNMARGAGRNPAGLYRGKGTGGELAWSVSDKDWLEHGDTMELWAMLDHIKSQGDEPICFVPHHLAPAEATLVVIDADEVTIEDLYQFQSDSPNDRALSVTLPLRGVIG